MLCAVPDTEGRGQESSKFYPGCHVVILLKIRLHRNWMRRWMKTRGRIQVMKATYSSCKEREGRRDLVFVPSVFRSRYCVKAAYNGMFYCMTYRVKTRQMFDSK